MDDCIKTHKTIIVFVINNNVDHVITATIITSSVDDDDNDGARAPKNFVQFHGI